MTPQLLTVVTKETLQQWPDSEWKNWCVEPKRDGFRAILKDGRLYSRTGKLLYNVSHITEEWDKDSRFVLDGEVYGMSWAETSSIARASKTQKDSSLKFMVFDWMLKSEWEKKACKLTLVERRSRPLTLTYKRFSNCVRPVSCPDYSSAEQAYKQYLVMGCDGLVLKRLDSLYEFKRTKTWLKWKPLLTYDCRVVGVKSGTGKYSDMLGALEILPEGSHVSSWCSGMTDEQRRQWWKPGKPPYDRIIEVHARGVHPSGRLIEPRFIRVREDK